VRVFDHDNRRIHHCSDRNGDTSQGHDVRGELEIVHADKREKDGDRQRQNSDQRAANVKEEDQADHAYNDDFLDEFLFQSRDRPLDQIRSVVGSNNLDSRRERRCNLFKFFLNPLDHPERVFPVTHDDHAANDLAPAI
jgi:hypothetical protein